MKSASLLRALALPLFLIACGDSGSGDTGGGEVAAEGGRARPGAGARLYQTNACHTCHGREGEGTALGPKLQGAEEHWTRDELAAYLADPQSVVLEDERLRAQMARYPARMASFKHLTPAEREQVAEHVLGL